MVAGGLRTAPGVFKGVINTSRFMMGAGRDSIAAAVRLGYAKVAARFSPTKRYDLGCEECLAAEGYQAKKDRLARRQELARSAERSAAQIKNPRQRQLALNRARRFKEDCEAAELARLSAHAYVVDVDPSKRPPPPVGWDVMTDDELVARGIDPKNLKTAKAMVYKTPPDWPGGPKVVLAFRGTLDKDDILTDADQALGDQTKQYDAAAQAGAEMSIAFGSKVVVTGHSLGGGKAQAAGVAGKLKGMMFNSAGVHAHSTMGKEPNLDDFVQYRTAGDPLTGLQNNRGLQVLALGGATVASTMGRTAQLYNVGAEFLGGPTLAAEYVSRLYKLDAGAMRNIIQTGRGIPPAYGRVVEVPAVNSEGYEFSRVDLGNQHSIDTVLRGIESRKIDDVANLCTQSGKRTPVSAYIGRTN